MQHNIYVALLTGSVLLSITILAAILYLRYQLNHPTVIQYPWPPPADKSKSDNNKKADNDKHTKVVIAGSYNPPHHGHLEMISYLARRYEKVYVVLGMNPNKHYQVSPARRAEWLERMLDAHPDLSGNYDPITGRPYRDNVKVDVTKSYIWRYAKENDAKYLFRGIRTWEKDGAEERSLHKLNLWGPIVVGMVWPVPTCYLEGKPEYIGISSTVIRDLCVGVTKSSTNDDTGSRSMKDAAIEDSSHARIKELERLVPCEVAKDIAMAYGSDD